MQYVSCHDNRTLFDQCILKCRPPRKVGDVCRAVHLALSIVALSQANPPYVARYMSYVASYMLHVACRAPCALYRCAFAGQPPPLPLPPPASALVAWPSIPVASRGTGRTQGVPFFCAGDELLRSKSFDRDSYASGDWFNAIMYDGSVRANGSNPTLGF